MFKKKIWLGGSLLVLGLFAMAGSGCRSLPPLPPADLSESGWTTWRGQAVWQPNADAPEIAGDLLLMLREDGSMLVQFAKPPFPLAIARTTPEAWQFESPSQNKRYTYPGEPPARIIWFQLARGWRTGSVLEPWEWTSERPPSPGLPATLSHPMGEGRGEGRSLEMNDIPATFGGSDASDVRFLLANKSTGETLEGYLVTQNPEAH